MGAPRKVITTLDYARDGEPLIVFADLDDTELLRMTLQDAMGMADTILSMAEDIAADGSGDWPQAGRS